MKGYIHVYTGNGKGKTTAAIGLSVRAVGAGKKVFFAQFVKGQIYSEVKTIQQFLPQIIIKQYGLDCFIYNGLGARSRSHSCENFKLETRTQI